MGISKRKYEELEREKYCQCDEPDMEGDNEDGYFCGKCNKDIYVPDYEPEYNGDEDLEEDKLNAIDMKKEMERGDENI